MKNPYPKNKEDLHLSWEHGFNSKSLDECPYEVDDPEAADAVHAWKSGFRAANKKESKKPALDKPTQEVVQTNSLVNFSTEELQQELAGRLKARYQTLEKLLEEKENEVIKIEIELKRLSVIMGMD